MVEAPDERALIGTRWSDDAQHEAEVEVEVEVKVEVEVEVKV